MDRRTLTMNWDGLGDYEDDDHFFESFDRISSVVPLDLASSGSDDDEFDDSRMSFASAMSSLSIKDFRSFQAVPTSSSSMLEDYNLWMGDLGSIKDRRKRLLQGMGLSSNKDLLSITGTKKVEENGHFPNATTVDSSSTPPPSEESKHEQPSPSKPIVLVRSRSDGDIESFSIYTKRRKEELIGSTSKQHLTRTSSSLLTTQAGVFQYANSIRISSKRARNVSAISNDGGLSSILSNGQFGGFFLIKNLDTGKEFIVNELNEDGMWNRLSDLETGKQLTVEEFEKSVGYSPVVKELMRREKVSENLDDEKKVNTNSYLSKSFRNSKRRGVAFLKNIKGVANSMTGLINDKERDSLPSDQRSNKNPSSSSSSSSQWVKVRQHGKSCKEFTALHLCQEIQAHEGSIWTIRFSSDGHYLASAGEDRVIHVWEVQECEVMAMRSSPDDLNSASSTPLHPMMCGSPDRPPLAELSPMPSERRKKGKSGSTKKKGNSIPDYVQVPETVFSLSEKPVCSFTGHLDDVLDLSWSKSQVS